MGPLEKTPFRKTLFAEPDKSLDATLLWIPDEHSSLALQRCEPCSYNLVRKGTTP